MKTLRKRSAVGSEPMFLSGDEWLPAWLQGIRHAKTSVYMAISCGVEDRRLALELEQAVKRGVEIRVVLAAPDALNEEGIAELLGSVRDWLQRGVSLQVVPRFEASVLWTDAEVLVLHGDFERAMNASISGFALRFDAERHPTSHGKFRAWIEEVCSEALTLAPLPAFASNAGSSMAHGLIVTTSVPVTERRRNPRARNLAKKRRRHGAHQPKPTEEMEPGCCISCALDVVFRPDRPLCRDCHQDWALREWNDREGQYCHACGEMDVVTEDAPFCEECATEL